MQNVDTGYLTGLLITGIIILAIALLFTIIVCLAYKSWCARLSAENHMLRRTVKGQDSLRAASSTAYQEMLNAAFGTMRVD